ncbi:hypothetical protein [Crenobacter cavernae]|uniref:Uncharacterized protein n=1 Tax=Crenobacter cavernae TaxID=2290923 RepID=A0A345Y7J7_9NEIS|nr:hypothetical protein [Crenobacter cavernae]AXK39899.1 hypothetical protein DWG20_10850 [Crenobacter cavernae]
MAGNAPKPSQTQETVPDTGEYSADQVHQFRVGQHLEEDEPLPEAEDEDPDTGEYQSDQVRQVKHHD